MLLFRTTAARTFPKGLAKFNATRSSYNAALASKLSLNAQLHSLSSKRPKATITVTSQLNLNAPLHSFSSKRPKAIVLTPLHSVTITSLRYATGPTKDSPFNKVDKAAEKKLGKEEIESHPDLVSVGSSVTHVFERSQNEDKDGDMLGGIRADIETVKDTFRLTDVPREAYYLGLAGLLPYMATSLSTVALAYDINHAHTAGSGIVFSPETAHQLLAIIEPIQIGYGAVIISFLGAIHWGLEYAGYGGYHKYRRYAIGVVAPAVAWPTLLMPVEYALISQFLAFNFLYFTDARATVKGWCPPWYSTYRFVLTFIAGAAIVLSLIGRGQIVQHDGKLPGPYDKMKALQDSQWESLEKEERERRRKLAEEEEEAVEEEAGEDDDEGDDKKGEKDKKDKKE